MCVLLCVDFVSEKCSGVWLCNGRCRLLPKIIHLLAFRSVYISPAKFFAENAQLRFQDIFPAQTDLSQNFPVSALYAKPSINLCLNAVWVTHCTRIYI